LSYTPWFVLPLNLLLVAGSTTRTYDIFRKTVILRVNFVTSDYYILLFHLQMDSNLVLFIGLND